MLEYDFVSLDTEWGTGYSLFGGVRIDTDGHREIIAQRAAEGWRYVGWLPTTQLLKSPTTLTLLAWGAHTRNTTPSSPFSCTQ